jgi:phosphoserine phosphatase
VETIKEMARQVLETMIKKAGFIQHKYNLVLFALDNTIVGKEGFSWFFKKLKIEKEIAYHNDLLEKGKINQGGYFKRNALLFKGMDVEVVKEITKKIPLVKYSKEVVETLEKRKYKVAIISANFSPMVEPIAQTLGVDFLRCIYLEVKNKKYTGELSAISKKIWLAEDYETAIKQAFNATLRKTKVKPLETVVVAHNEKFLPLFKKAGLSIAYKPKSRELKEAAAKTISLPAEILAIIE